MRLGTKHSSETIEKLLRASEADIRYLPNSNHGYCMCGISTERNKARNTPEQIKWRKDIQERDNYICQRCFRIGCKLHSHHIKSFAKYPELRIELSNGISWCEDCHYDWHKENGFR